MALLTAQNLNQEIAANLPTNNNNQIAAAALRQTLSDMVTATFQGISDPSQYAQVQVYAGGVANSELFVARGSAASPVTDLGAAAVFQTFGAPASNGGTTVYASWAKYSTGPFIGGRAIWAEAVDEVGGANSYVEAIRGSATLQSGTGGNAVGIVSYAATANLIPYAYLVGHEAQIFNSSGTDATTTFSSAKFAAAFLASCAPNGALNKADAGFMTNPHNLTPFINGFYVAASSVDASGAAFRSDAASTWGVYLLNGTFSSGAFRSTGCQIDGNGNFTGAFAALGGATLSAAAVMSLVAPTTAFAQINFAAGTAPTAPNNGDFWFDGTNLNIRIAGSTKTITHS